MDVASHVNKCNVNGLAAIFARFPGEAIMPVMSQITDIVPIANIANKQTVDDFAKAHRDEAVPVAFR